MPATHGQQAVIRYIAETTPGTFPTNPALLLFSKATPRVKILLDKDHKEALDIGNNDVEELFSAKNIYGVEVEYDIYNPDRFEEFLNRNADGTVKAYSLELIPDLDASTKHWIRGTGWRAQTSVLRGADGEKWVGRQVFTAGKWSDPVTTDPGVGTGSREAKSAFTGNNANVKHWASGAITLDGAALAVLMEEFELTIEQGSEAGYTTGSADPAADGAKKAVRRYRGSCGLGLDNGIADHWTRVKGFAAASTGIVIPFGSAGHKKITLSGVRWPSLDAEITAEMGQLMANVPFRATGHTLGTV